MIDITEMTATAVLLFSVRYLFDYLKTNIRIAKSFLVIVVSKKKGPLRFRSDTNNSTGFHQRSLSELFIEIIVQQLNSYSLLFLVDAYRFSSLRQSLYAPVVSTPS